MKKLITLLLVTTMVVPSLQAQDTDPIGKNDQVVQGFARKVSGLDFHYHSSLPDINQALLVRALDGTQRMEWETDPAPAKPAGKFVTFVWLGAVGA
ncbi:MAG: hypothetical protein R6V75_02585, partial [Bacteroidales bacterium]